MFRLTFDLRLLLVAAAIGAALSAAGCRSSFVDVAKGHPTEPESNYVQSDYEPKQESAWEQFAPENLWKTAKKAVGLGPNELIARKLFEEGYAQYKDKQYDKAGKLLAKAADRWPDSTLEEDAMFLQSESYFFANRFSKAVDTYGELIKKYPNTRHLNLVVSRQFAIARYWQEKDQLFHRWTLIPNLVDRTQPLFDTRGHSINTFDNVRVNDPRGPLADSAVMAVAQQYFLLKRYEDADYYFNLLRTDYPKSKYQLQAHLLGIQCKFLKYQGPRYNTKPIEEADQLIDQTLVQFGAELGNERDHLVRAKAEIKAQKATRDIQLAQYWDHGEHFGAARIYYARVLKDYPQTPFADQAKTRLAELEGKPNNPPNRIALLTDFLNPASKKEREENENVILPADSSPTRRY